MLLRPYLNKHLVQKDKHGVLYLYLTMQLANSYFSDTLNAYWLSSKIYSTE
jgi:hypothetical protein